MVIDNSVPSKLRKSRQVNNGRIAWVPQGGCTHNAMLGGGFGQWRGKQLAESHFSLSNLAGATKCNISIVYSLVRKGK